MRSRARQDAAPVAGLGDRSAKQFEPPWWLKGGHLQGLWGPAVRPRALVRFERERIETPDGDELFLDHLRGSPAQPRLLVLHGLEGSSYSPYVQGMMVLAQQRGWSAVGFNCRSCARDPRDTVTWLPSRTERLYHSGETRDLDLAVRHLHDSAPSQPLFAVGVSMGGNMLLKWLGENPDQDLLAAGVSISAPYDLGAGAAHLETSFAGWYYTRHFLQTLRQKVEWLARTFPAVAARIDVAAALQAQFFRAFDNACTAPLHGFADADDFYARCSAIEFVDRISTPTLCINAEDDPLIPADVLPRARKRAAAAVQFNISPAGGHVGFVAGSPWAPRYWAEEYAIEWLERSA